MSIFRGEKHSQNNAKELVSIQRYKDKKKFQDYILRISFQRKRKFNKMEGRISILEF